MDDSAQRMTQMEQRLSKVEAGLERVEAGQAKLEAGQAKLEAGQAKLEAGLAKLEVRMDGVETGLADVKRLMETLVPMMVRIDERLAHQPAPSEFYELRGRVEEMSRRMPVTLSYQTPDKRTV